MLITSRLEGDNLRVLIKDQLSESQPKVRSLEVKDHKNENAVFIIKIPDFFAKRSPDCGNITGDNIADMLNNERKNSINKISSIINPTNHSHDSEENLANLIDIMSVQQELASVGYSNIEYIPHAISGYLNNLINQ
jgi:hypothetical protein